VPDPIPRLRLAPDAPGTPGPPGGTGTATAGALDALTATIRASAPRAGSTRIVAVEGRSGSGKTTLAGLLSARLAGPDRVPAPVLHLDDLYPGWDGLADATELLRAGVLAPLAEGRPAGFPRHDWATGSTGPWQPVPAVPVLIVEGIGCGARSCTRYLSVLIWLTAGEAVRRDRALRRDGDTYARQWQRWARHEEAYLASEDPAGHADVRYRTDPPPP
jgi:uridine kinase